MQGRGEGGFFFFLFSHKLISVEGVVSFACPKSVTALKMVAYGLIRVPLITALSAGVHIPTVAVCGNSTRDSWLLTKIWV